MGHFSHFDSKLNRKDYSLNINSADSMKFLILSCNLNCENSLKNIKFEDSMLKITYRDSVLSNLNDLYSPISNTFLRVLHLVYVDDLKLHRILLPINSDVCMVCETFVTGNRDDCTLLAPQSNYGSTASCFLGIG